MKPEDALKSKPRGRIVAPGVRKEAVEKLKSGMLRLGEIAALYGVSVPTVSNWRRHERDAEGGIDPMEEVLDMERIANEVIDGVLSEQEAMARYGLTKLHRLRYWRGRVSRKNWARRRKNGLIVADIVSMKKKGGKGATPKDEVALLVSELEAVRLRVAALETLIDVTEQQTGLDIRKKGGSKRSRR